MKKSIISPKHFKLLTKITKRNYSSQPLEKGPKFVFLEGPAGVGKTSICNLLEKNRFNVRYEKFVELCDANPLYSPTGSIMTIKFVSTLLSSLERYHKEYNEDTSISEQDDKKNYDATIRKKIIFIDRSFLSPYIYARGQLNNHYVLDAMKEVKQTYPSTVVLCQTNEETMRDRLRNRYDKGDDQEKEIRKSLGELNDNYLHFIRNRYKRLERDCWFELSIDCSNDINTVTSDLLAKVGVDIKEIDWTPANL
eukprot:TRINITY_DN12995_c0_g1_i1.p1 TRINITY_DN12995_c0_g1~~TRINITY_DN12995_c0_g1_i1.p1  ORF type:complete len:252 (-),score=41.21 TRINITY_DN12995_c0_g1_i1:70-825(-)